MQDNDSTGSSGDRVEHKTCHASDAMTILIFFGLEDLVQSLLAENGVDRLGNLLSLDPHCHTEFDNLNLWFEHTKMPNRYQVCVADPIKEVYLSRFSHLESDNLGRLFVTFSRTDDRQEFPDPRLLGLHAVCARVAHMFGAAEAIDKAKCDLEDALVLAQDG